MPASIATTDIKCLNQCIHYTAHFVPKVMLSIAILKGKSNSTHAGAETTISCNQKREIAHVSYEYIKCLYFYASL